VGNGSEDILQMLCQAFLSPGDRVLAQRPAFGLHEIYPRMMGARVELLELTPALGFDVDAWCEALARGPKIAMLANPSNPVGCMFDADEFARLLDATPAQTLLVVDEAYYEYALHAEGYPDVLALLRGRAMPWIVLRTPFNVNQAAQAAALAAWGDEGFMQRGVAETVRLRDALARRLAALPVRMAPSAANFLFIDIGCPNGPVNEALLARGLITKPWKEPGFEHFIRVSVGTEADNERFAAALAAILEEGQ
jgi:histidinol-phosphate aminotransferase